MLLVVHDFNQVDLRLRVDRLREVFPQATVTGAASRQVLLNQIAAMPQRKMRELRPIALIDLQGDEDRHARGEHLIATVARHPDLRGRAALVAFSRYGHPERDHQLRALGAVGVLSPQSLGIRSAEIVRDLERLARGDRTFTRIGSSPSVEDRQGMMAAIERLFPGVLSEQDPHAAWLEAKDIMFACRMAADGYDDTDIASALGWLSVRRLRELREALLNSEWAAGGALPPGGRTASLGAVAQMLFEEAEDAESRWQLTTGRRELDNPARLQWVADRLSDLYPPDDQLGAVRDDAAWLPPESIPVMRRFFLAYDEAKRELPGTHASLEVRRQRADLALRAVGIALGKERNDVRQQVEHGVLCLEEAMLPDHY